MGNLGGGEILVILLVALVVLGPTKLPDAARQIGRAAAELRRMSGAFQRELREAIHEPISETKAMLKEPVAETKAMLKEPVAETKATIKGTGTTPAKPRSSDARSGDDTAAGSQTSPNGSDAASTGERDDASG